MSNKYDWDAIKQSVSSSDVIGNYVELKKRGNLHEGLCPFHNESNPSFKVYEDGYHCFGCGAHGDVIDFVKAMENCDTSDAISKIVGEDFSPSPEQKAQATERKQQREADDVAVKKAVIERCRKRWEMAPEAPEIHPYLVAKKIEPHMARIEGDNLLIPIYDRNGDIQCIQMITPKKNKEGKNKFFPEDGTVKGGRLNFGIMFGKTIVCEGFATGASIYEATMERVCVGFSHEGVKSIVSELVSLGLPVVIAADHKGLADMLEFAEGLGVPVYVPHPEHNDDFNDMASALGKTRVSDVFHGAPHTGEAIPASIEKRVSGLPFDITGVDLLSPPGFAGELAAWIESQSRRPRATLAVAGALTALGNIAGLRYIDERDRVTSNLFAFCVAGSRTGKESIQQAVSEIHRVAKMAGASHGSIKSEQEIVRNLIRHQASFYVIDEIAHLLKKVKNAQTKGGSSYLDGIIGILMSAYSKSNGYMLLTGDAKEAIRGDLVKLLSQHERKLDNGNEVSPYQEKAIERVHHQLATLDDGLPSPFLSMIGFTTPVDFDDLVDFQSATNGFIGRSLLFNERDTAPRSKTGFSKPAMSEGMMARIGMIASSGEFDTLAPTRIEMHGDRQAIPSTPRASQMLDQALDWFEDQAITHKGSSGLESLYLGAYEIMSKVSFILAIPDGQRDAEHVRWAFALVRRDVDEKVRLVTVNDRAQDAPMDAMQAKIANICADEGETVGVIYNRLRGKKREDVDKALAAMVDKGVILKEWYTHKGNGKKIERYRFVGM